MPHVLLVDDEAALCDSLTYTLQKEGYTVTTAADGHSAIKQFHKQVPDVILLDLMLPEVDGMEVCWRIRAFSNVPIVMLTAKDEDIDKIWGLEAGADDYITTAVQHPRTTSTHQSSIASSFWGAAFMRGWIPGIKLNTIYAKLLGTYLMLTAFGTSLMAGYILWSFHDYFMRSRQADLDNWTSALSESVADALEEKDIKQVKVLVQRYGAPQTITLRVFSQQGSLLATSDPRLDSQVKDWSQVPGIREALQNRVKQGIAKGVLSNSDRLYITRPIERNGQLLGVIRMSMTLEQLQRQFARVIWSILGTLAVTILLCALISSRFARSLSKPIEIMQNFAIRLGGGHFGDKLTIHENNELDQLAAELNRMSERLASLDKERRVFLANVSHELRTPISNVQVTVDALKAGAYEEPELRVSEARRRHRFFQTIENETKRLSRLIHDLLDLGRLEAGVFELEKQPISLHRLINRAVNALEPRMRTLGISTRVNVENLIIQGDPERLLQAILNLLDNAIKHSPANSQVSISGYSQGKQAIIQIQDQGKGIKEGDLPRIFEQFYTTDPARKGSGNGLGLAISKRIIEAHQGSIIASSTSNQGATFTIYLPIIRNS